MPKIRGVKPDYWTDDDIVELSIPARLLFIGLWNYACDNGHLQDKPRQIKIRVMPGDDVSVPELLRELEEKERIRRVDGWITVPNLAKHQKVDRRYFTTCDHPGCEEPEATTSQRESRRAHAVQPTGTRSAHDGRTPVALGDGEVMVKGSDGDRPTASKSRKRPAITIPSGWKPTTEHLTRALEAGLVLAGEVEKFRLHAETHDRRAANWNAAFTQWLIKATEYAEQNRPAQRPTYNLPHVSQLEQPPDGLTSTEYREWERAQRAKRASR